MAQDGARLERFDRTIEAIYAAAAAPESWPDALQHIADMFGDHGANLTYFHANGSYGAIVSPTLLPGLDEYNGHWWRHDIRSQRGVERGYLARSDVLTDADLGPVEELHAHPFYSEFLARHGLGWFATVVLAPSPGSHVALSVQRLADKPPFDASECALLARLGRHAEQSLSLGLRLARSEAVNEGFRSALLGLNVGAFLLDADERLLFANEIAGGLVGNGLEVSAGRLVVTSKARPLLPEPVAASREPALDRPPVLVGRGDELPPILLHFIPTQPGNSLWARELLGEVRLIVLAIEVSPRSPVDPMVVRDLLGLTLGEARVASLVGAGLSLRHASEQLGITVESVRTVLKRVYSKTEISRQSELAALLGKILVA
jgi:DNA-binding CsgD family transcriptional regulator